MILSAALFYLYLDRCLISLDVATDPELNAWWDSANGEEIGDLCAWMFSTADWDSGLANQMWNGHFYDLQLEYDNHTASCVKLGP